MAQITPSATSHLRGYRACTLLGLAIGLAVHTGCVRRTISITTDPPGALVYLNDREIGRTPVEVGFTFYGTYDLRLLREGYEPLSTHAKAKAPWWQLPPLDLASEAIPGELRDRITWHFVLDPLESDPERLLERARELREETIGSDDGDD